MASLRAFDVIQGQAAPRAITLRAIVQSYGHQMILVESTATRCRMKGLRRGDTEWQNVTWTIDRARELGLVGKDSWKKQPAAMLVARATSELARLIAADAILGIGYTVEEVSDGAVIEYSTTTVDTEPEQPSGGSRRMSRRQPSEPATDDPDGITKDQLKALHAGLSDLGIGSPDKRDVALEFYRQVIDRGVDSSKKLTKAEASRVIDAIQHELRTRPDATTDTLPEPPEEPW